MATEIERKNESDISIDEEGNENPLVFDTNASEPHKSLRPKKKAKRPSKIGAASNGHHIPSLNEVNGYVNGVTSAPRSLKNSRRSRSGYGRGLPKKTYIQACAAFCVITFLLDAAATVLTGAGLSLKDPGKKYLFYKIAVYVMIAALVCVLISLVVYPVCFAGELQYGNRTKWEFGWAYGVAWGAAIFLFGGIVLLLCDKESEEIYYKERTIVHGEGDAKA